MQSAQRRRVFVVLLGVLAVLVVLAGLRGGLDFAKHETDMLHLVDIVLRLEAGQGIHQDFMTPLGLWSVAPFAGLKAAGLGLGAALKWGQIGLAAVLLLPVWYVGVSRMRTPWLAAAFGAVVLLTAAGMVYGGTNEKLSLSMHYNRWSWAIVFLPLGLVALPAERPVLGAVFWVEALIIGVAMAALTLVKVTYFVAFAPAVIAGLLLRGQGRLLGASVLVGLAVLAVQTLVSGVAFWQGYIADLLAVAVSDVRPQPGRGWAQIVLSPAYAAGTLLAVGSVLWLRSKLAGNPTGLVLALILPGAIYVSYQNYGNDPFWLVLWGFVLLALALETGARPLQFGGAIALALIAPVAINIGVSPLRHVIQPASAFSPLLPEHADLRGVTARFDTIAAQWPLGELDGDCKLASGAVGYMRAMAQTLEEEGFAGERVYAAGLFNPFWLLADLKPLQGGAPWYYGGLSGIEDASLFVLPECNIRPEFKELVMREITARGIKLVPVFQDEQMAVYRPQLP